MFTPFVITQKYEEEKSMDFSEDIQKLTQN